MTEKQLLKVGDTVLVFDLNHRVYRRDDKGRSFGSPIYREHFVPTEIVGETSRSWILRRYNKKVPKATLEGIYTPQQADEQSWVQEHRHRIADAICFVRDVGTLKKVAELVGYKEPDPA